MAEAAILAALKVLGVTLSKEVVNLATSKISELCSAYANLEANMNNISSELCVMQGFLDEIETDHPSSKSQAAWIKQVQKLANHIEDSVVELAYLIGNQKLEGTSLYVKKLFKKPKLLVDFKRIASQLLEAEKSLNNLARMKERWLPPIDIKNGKNSNFSNQYSHSVAVSAHFIDENQIVGNEQNRVKLASWLNSQDPELSIISIWGMGGVGKTTLVTNVFKREKNNFDCHAWINISQSYTTENLLRNIIFEISKKEQNISINMDLRGLKETVRVLLREKKYLIILDDMWDPKAFQEIRDTLINNRRKSRIMITSRMVEVANLAPVSKQLELKPLSKNESWDLFCRKAFNLEENHQCPPPLEKWASEIVVKCDGLPLALVSLGGVLSCSEKTEYEWRRVRDQLTWELDNNPSLNHQKNILNLSFKYLPKYLKNCFLHCSLFPEDFPLPRKKLIRLWIAEGFIEQKGTSTLEEVAEGYLMELIHRSMLQVVKKNYFGRVKRCQMHDTLRELAISLCKKEHFGLIHEDNKSENADGSTRRLSIINLRETVKQDVCLPKLRTFLSVDNDVPSSPLLSMIFDKSRYLTVVDLEGLPIETVPNAIGDLFNLHYLGLRKTKVKSLPKSIKKLQNLQTLDLIFSQIQTLPDGIAELKKLRHVFAEVVVDATYKSFQNCTGISLEDVAEGYLMELVNRCMLQVARKNYFGRVKRCKMHDTFKELSISLCKKENFGLLHDDNNSENADGSTRRLSIINLRETVKYDVCLPKLRTFLSVHNDVPSSPLLSMIFDKSRYLTVLDLEGLPIETVPNSIGDLFNLHYLGLRKTKVKSLPKSIKKLQNLQTLDLIFSQIQTLPDGIGELKKLRHLFVPVVVDPTYRSFRNYTGISSPKGIFYLKDLQTIQALESNAMVVRELGNLTQLRSFRIWNVKENHSVELCKSLSKMSFLSNLYINASNEEEILQLEGLNLPQIQKLVLRGKLKETMLESPLFKISRDSIQTLQLGWSQLQNDPLSSLSHCRNLTFLSLKRAYEGQRLIFQVGWFPKLKILDLDIMPNLIQVEMEQGTMASLEQIWLRELKQLVEVPVGIKYLTSLKWMSCIDMPVDFGGLAKGTHKLFHFTCRVR